MVPVPAPPPAGLPASPSASFSALTSSVGTLVHAVVASATTESAVSLLLVGQSYCVRILIWGPLLAAVVKCAAAASARAATYVPPSAAVVIRRALARARGRSCQPAHAWEVCTCVRASAGSCSMVAAISDNEARAAKRVGKSAHADTAPGTTSWPRESGARQSQVWARAHGDGNKNAVSFAAHRAFVTEQSVSRSLLLRRLRRAPWRRRSTVSETLRGHGA